MLDRDACWALVADMRRALSERLIRQGWTGLEEPACRRPAIGAFAQTLEHGFSALAVFPWLNDESGLQVVGRVGVGYHPAAAFIAAFTGSGVSGAILNTPSTSISISDADELPEATDKLVSLAVDRGVPLAQRNADVDVLIKMVRLHEAVPFVGDADPVYAAPIPRSGYIPPLASYSRELIPALLAMAGRHDEARQALAEYTSGSQDEATARRCNRFVRQLTRWLDAGGELPMPTTPAEWLPPANLEPRRSSSSEAFETGRRESRAQRDAIDAVRAVAAGKTKNEIKALLEQEFAARELRIAPSVLLRHIAFIEAERERFGKVRMILSTLRQLNEFGSGVARFLDSSGQPARAPAWLKPPDYAAYPVRTRNPTWAAVELSDDAIPWLKHVAQSGAEREVHSCVVELWLTVGPDQLSDDLQLFVHLGEQQVGILRAEAAEHFRSVVEAAAQRDEAPWTGGRLTTAPDWTPYLLEIALP